MVNYIFWLTSDKNEEKNLCSMIQMFLNGRIISASGHRLTFLFLLLKEDLGLKDYGLPMELVLVYNREYQLICRLCRLVEDRN